MNYTNEVEDLHAETGMLMGLMAGSFAYFSKHLCWLQATQEKPCLQNNVNQFGSMPFAESSPLKTNLTMIWSRRSAKPLGK